jgi:hypothetical protein
MKMRTKRKKNKGEEWKGTKIQKKINNKEAPWNKSYVATIK